MNVSIILQHNVFQNVHHFAILCCIVSSGRSDLLPPTCHRLNRPLLCFSEGGRQELLDNGVATAGNLPATPIVELLEMMKMMITDTKILKISEATSLKGCHW